LAVLGREFERPDLKRRSSAAVSAFGTPPGKFELIPSGRGATNGDQGRDKMPNSNMNVRPLDQQKRQE
jgi:hypothetical protein